MTHLISLEQMWQLVFSHLCNLDLELLTFLWTIIINTAQNTYLPCMHACLNVFLYNASYCFTIIKTCWLGPSGSLWLLQTHKQGDALAFLIVKEGGEKGVFHCEGQSGASGYCKSMMLYDILLSLTTGMPLKGAVMSVCCVCARTVCMCRVRVSDFLQDFDSDGYNMPSPSHQTSTEATRNKRKENCNCLDWTFGIMNKHTHA